MFKITISVLVYLWCLQTNASPLVFISPETASDRGLEGHIKSVSGRTYCIETPDDEFRESYSEYDNRGRLLTRTTKATDQSYYLHPLAASNNMTQIFVDGEIAGYTSKMNSNGVSNTLNAEVVSRDDRQRPTIIKAIGINIDKRGEEKKIQFVYGLKYGQGTVVIDNRVKITGLPVISYKSVAEVDSRNHITRLTSQDPTTKALSTEFTNNYEEQRPEKITSATGGILQFHYDGERLSSIEQMSGLGIISYIVSIKDVEYDNCGNQLNAKLIIKSPIKDKLDSLFAINDEFSDLRANSEDPTGSSENFRLPNCSVYQMIYTYEYYQPCEAD